MKLRKRLLIALEAHVDGIDGDTTRGQQRLAAGHEVAGGDLRAADDGR